MRNQAGISNQPKDRAKVWRYRMFYLDLDVLRALAAEITDRQWVAPYFAATVIHDPAVAAQLRALHLSLERGDLRLEQDTQTLTTLAALVVRHADDRPALRRLGDERETVARAKTYIEGIVRITSRWRKLQP